MENSPTPRSEEEYLASIHPSFRILAPKPPIIAAMLVIIALVCLLAVYTAYLKYREVKSLSFPTAQLQTVRMANSSGSNNGVVTFNSETLGVSFRYDPQKISVVAKENIIHINFPNDKVDSGDYFEVFNKQPEDSIISAIWKSALPNFSDKQCKVLVTTDFPYLNRFTVAHVFPTDFSNGTMDGSCPGQYNDAGSPGLFIYDRTHPTVFAFWRGGAALDTSLIFDTFEFMDQAAGTSSWKTYRIEKYGFEFKYPTNWYVSGGERGPTQYFVCLNPIGMSGDCTGLLTVNTGVSLNEFYGRMKAMFSQNLSVSESNAPVSGVTGKLLTIGGSGFSRSLFWENNGSIYNFEIVVGNEKLFDEIISTFKFTDENLTDTTG